MSKAFYCSYTYFTSKYFNHIINCLDFFNNNKVLKINPKDYV